MFLDSDQCYRALRTHDARFDGRFFVGVGTTGIYCRPVCSARTPLAETAVISRVRPPRRRAAFAPACAAGRNWRRARRDRREPAARASRRGPDRGRTLDDASLAAIATALGVTDRHLRRVFGQEFGVAPVAYAQTQRLLLAKRLLTDTDLPVIDVAMASGFGAFGGSMTFSARVIG